MKTEILPEHEPDELGITVYDDSSVVNDADYYYFGNIKRRLTPVELYIASNFEGMGCELCGQAIGGFVVDGLDGEGFSSSWRDVCTSTWYPGLYFCEDCVPASPPNEEDEDE